MLYSICYFRIFCCFVVVCFSYSKIGSVLDGLFAIFMWIFENENQLIRLFISTFKYLMAILKFLSQNFIMGV